MFSRLPIDMYLDVGDNSAAKLSKSMKAQRPDDVKYLSVVDIVIGQEKTRTVKEDKVLSNGSNFESGVNDCNLVIIINVFYRVTLICISCENNCIIVSILYSKTWTVKRF